MFCSKVNERIEKRNGRRGYLRRRIAIFQTCIRLFLNSQFLSLERVKVLKLKGARHWH